MGLANGLRRVSQAFTPIFTPVVAGMTATGAHGEAAATYSRLLKWMLWILIPATAAMILAGPTILLVYGRGFQQGSSWLAVVAIACATNAFVTLGETVIMVQRPGLNLLNSAITCLLGSVATFWLISQFGMIGAAFGLLTTYSIQGVIRTVILRTVFHWPRPWSDVRSVVFVTLAAVTPAVALRIAVPGAIGQLGSALICLTIFGLGWFYFRRKPVST